MNFIESVADLETHYGIPADAATRKITPRMTPEYRDWIMRSKFCVLTTVGPEGTDGSPRGDDGPVVTELDEKTLAMPDWRGNQRIDSLRNIVRDPRVSLMFMIPGSNNVIRLNGEARISVDDDLRARFARKEGAPRTVIVIKIGEIYFQCARALLRSGLWKGDAADGLPTPGQLLASLTDGEVGGDAYDIEWPQRASETMW
jgi:PPOX class probable FMN-dependent enzyme